MTIPPPFQVIIMVRAGWSIQRYKDGHALVVPMPTTRDIAMTSSALALAEEAARTRVRDNPERR